MGTETEIWAVVAIAATHSPLSLHDFLELWMDENPTLNALHQDEEFFGLLRAQIQWFNGPTSLRQDPAFRTSLTILGKENGFDTALIRKADVGRFKRPVGFDLDSTLICEEVIDEFARERGVYPQVQTLTESAMKGQLDYTQSLQARVKLLKGLTLQEIQRVYDRIQLRPGAESLMNYLHQQGHPTAIFSGGFSEIANRLGKRLKIDYVISNRLEMKDGVCTGEISTPVVDAARKKSEFLTFANHSPNSMAIGDGANDVQMLDSAAYGVSFAGKPPLVPHATVLIREPHFASVEFLVRILDQKVI